MKLILLTSSIFYLLGLKLTHEVKLTESFKTDSVQITTSTEQIKQPEIKQIQELPSSTTQQDEPDSIKHSGSSENTAPFYLFLENIN